MTHDLDAYVGYAFGGILVPVLMLGLIVLLPFALLGWLIKKAIG